MTGLKINTLALKKFIKAEEKTTMEGLAYKVLTFISDLNGVERFISFTLAPFKQNAIDMAEIIRNHLNQEIIVNDEDLIKREWVSKVNGEPRIQYDLKRPITNLRKLNPNLFLTKTERLIREW